MTAETALILFTLSPDAEGRRKAAVAPGCARRLFRGLIEHVHEQVRDTPGIDLLVSAPDGWSPTGAVALPQRGADFGASLRLAVDDAFARGYRRVLLIGNDAPGLTASRLQIAVDTLERGASRQAVVTPTHDGGFALLGLSRPTADAFVGIPWGTDSVCRATVTRLAQDGFDVTALPPVDDIDSASDLHRFLRQGRFVSGLFTMVNALRSWIASTAPPWTPASAAPLRSMTPAVRNWRAPPA